MTVNGAAPATPKNTTDGTPSRFRASARETMSGPAGSGRFITGLQAWMLALRPLRRRQWRPRALIRGRPRALTRGPRGAGAFVGVVIGDRPRGRIRRPPRCGRRALVDQR